MISSVGKRGVLLSLSVLSLALAGAFGISATTAGDRPAKTTPHAKQPTQKRPQARGPRVLHAERLSRRMPGGSATEGVTPGWFDQSQQSNAPAVHRAGREQRMQRATPFDGDLRDLPQNGPKLRERPEREAPEVVPVPFPSANPRAPSATAETSGTTPPAGQAAPSAPAPSPIANFDGLDYATWGAGHPPDTNGDVGPTYYIETVNTSIGIYRKSDGTRVAAFTFDTFMSQGHFGNLCDTDNFGDPVVLYDSFEDRWVITDFAFQLDGSGNVINPPGSFQCFAVSKSGDPVAGGWNFYSINTAGGLGDYPKFGIWPDGLYMSANMFDYAASGSFQNARLYAFNKAQMYAGAATIQVVSFDAPSSEFTMLPANARLQTGTPPAGSPNYYATVWNYLNVVGIWKFHVDWNDISLSTLTGPFNATTTFWWAQYSGTNGDAPTPKNSLDTLYPRLMMQNQYTNISGVESLWDSQTAGAGNPTTSVTSAQAAVRYYQVKVTGGTVESTATQAFTYSPDSTLYRFMPSVAVNKLGDMAIGYSGSNSTTNPVINYAGRLSGDPANSITQTESTLIAGTGSQQGNCGSSACTRWGDYSAMSLDPDGCTFWYTNEYYAANGLNDLTRIGSFRFSGCTQNTIQTGTVQGTVTSGGAPVAGATVMLGSGRSATTDSNGNYQFTSIPAGIYPTMSATYPGLNPGSATNIVVTNNATTVQNFVLTVAPVSGCFTDTTQADFQAGIPTNCDLTTSANNVILLNAPTLNLSVTDSSTNGFGFTSTSFPGQTFTANVTGQLTRLDVEIFCANTCSGTDPNIIGEIRTTSGGVPVMTAGGLLASVSIPGTSSASGGFMTFSFSSPPTLTSGTQYAFIVKLAANRTAGTQAYVVTSGDVYTGGRRYVCSTSSCSTPSGQNANSDVHFHTYMKTGFAASGTFVSSLKDANPAPGATPTWSTISWNATVPANTTLKMQVASSNSATGPFTFVGPDGTSATYFTSGGSLAQFNGNRFLRYEAFFTTSDSTKTATLSDVTLCFSDGNVTPPGAPTISANPGNAQVSVSWGAVSGATSYNVYRSTTSGAETLLASNVATTSYNDTAVTNGTTYFYKATAVNSGGEGPLSNEVSATPQVPAPATPTGLNASGGNAQVSLTWNSVSGATSYKVYRSTASGAETFLVSGIATASYFDNSVTNGTTYFYKVSAVNAGGESGLSNEASATPQVPAPAAPTGLSATAGTSQVSLSWTAPSGASSYKVYRSTTSGAEALLVSGIVSTSYNDTTVTNGTKYFYKVSAVNAGGESPLSSEVNATPQGVFVSINAAAQANGGVATASSSYSGSYPASSVNDGDRKGLNWGNGGGWNDATAGSYPDWVQINFSSAQTIGEIDVFTLQDNFSSPATPTLSMTFNNYGITSFEAQYWTGSAWVDVPGGNVTGNNLVWRQFIFNPVNTDRIRVLVNNSLASYSRLTEVEAWTAAGGGTPAPTVTLTSPANNTTLSAPATVNLSANASESGGSISKVEFYRDTTLVATVTTGNAGVYTASDTSVPAGTYSYTAKAYDAANVTTTSTSASVTVTNGSINVAAQANGGVATASSSYSSSYPASSVNDGDRKGLNWGNGGGWNDATGGAYPDWVQINFSATQSIGEIDVFTLQDSFSAPQDPTPLLTFSKYGITDFEVQYWNGSAWVDVSGGNVTGNNLVWRKFVFSPVSTDRIRVLVNNSLASYSRLTEVEAWTASGGTPTPTVTLTSPANNSTLAAPATVNLSATASEVGGSISKVEFYRDTTLVATATVPNAGVYSGTDSNVPVGTYSYTAKAYDAANVTTTSASASVTVTNGSINVAAQANGGVATASSSYSSSYPASSVNDGDRKGLNWGNGGGWNDATAGSYPDWVQINFSATQNIGEIDVFTLQDSFSAPQDPTLAMTFNNYGITDFEVQYWNGSSWVDVSGGNVTGNNMVWRQFVFSPVSTDRIRVLVNNALASYSRITEVEAWTR